MPAIATLRPDFYRIPLPVVLTDSTHGDMKYFELITARVTDAEGVEGAQTPSVVADAVALTNRSLDLLSHTLQ